MAEEFHNGESEQIFALITPFYPAECPSLCSILGSSPCFLPNQLHAAVSIQRPELSFASRHICAPYFDSGPHPDPWRIGRRLPAPERGLLDTTTPRIVPMPPALVRFAPAEADPCCTAPMIPPRRLLAKADSRRLSAQSLAARTRREKISRRMKELGRLIPGGSRMTSADMLTAGFGYVTFMQAQVGILRVIGSIRDRRLSPEVEQKLGVLVASAAFQEKLARAGHCVVPMEGISAMYEDDAVKSEPSIVTELDRLLDSRLV